MTAPSLFAVGGYAPASTVSARSVTVPTGTAIGQIAVMIIYNEGSVALTTLPSGFAHAPSSPNINATGSSHRINIIWKRLTAADSGSYAYSFAGTTFNMGQAFTFTDVVASGSPWDSDVNVGTSGATVTANSPSTNITTTGVDRLILSGIGAFDDLTVDKAGSPPTGYTLLGNKQHFMLSSKTQAVAGATGGVIATCPETTSWTAWLGALLPVAASAPQSSATFLPFFASV